MNDYIKYLPNIVQLSGVIIFDDNECLLKFSVSFFTYTFKLLIFNQWKYKYL